MTHTHTHTHLISLSLSLSLSLCQALEVARTEADGLKQALNQEIERRKECEVTSVERETELAQALMRLGEYERVSDLYI